ncbi:N-6 DNA methylase [Acinetobacter soli]|uniref:N-6 DNA methylase n=1 Tax=Acinetobacter soli TaxID=487316 RepID=UPI00125F1CF2|nr:N-6 DNA methylase [Acinetobacter soli]
MKLIENNLDINMVKNKKKLGAFYTPDNLCQILADWAITSPTDKVLEPSFGQCGFLEASRIRLESIGCEDPKNNIYGCDIDSAAFVFLKKILGEPIDQKKFILEDFMKLWPNVHWKDDFNASIGNPPYISSHNLAMEDKKNYFRRWKKFGIKINNKSSLWAHFLIHATTFIAPNGRLAWVLPGALLQADYAINIRDYLGMIFQDIICILMEERFFLQEGTEEETVILLAKNKLPQTNPQPICFANASNLDELKKIINVWDNNTWCGQYVTARPAYLYSNNNALSTYNSIEQLNDTKTLGELIKITLGIVTGNNDFFVINEQTRKEHKINNSYIRNILSRIKRSRGLNYTQEDHDFIVKENLPCYLIHAPKIRKNSHINKYLSLLSEDEISKNRTFSKRQPWYAPDDGLIPDAFLSVMNHYGPKMVLNDAKVTCTNTIYRAYFIKEKSSDVERKLIAISLLTSFSQLSAEFTGRRYGSGVLKHEPSEMRKIQLILPTNIKETQIHDFFSKIDLALRNNKHNEATTIADELIMSHLPNGQQLSLILQNELNSIRIRRQRSKYLSGA